MATFGGIPFRRKKDAVLIDEAVQPIFNPRTELLHGSRRISVRSANRGTGCKCITSANSPT